MLTTAAQRRAEDMAERVDAWRTANALIRSFGEWPDEVAPYDVTPYDVFQLAQFLYGPADD
jgi:hypothetical protein